MVIKNGKVVTENSLVKTDVLIRHGVIKAIGDNLSDRDEIDATGKYVLPGGIDVHTHFDLDVGIAVAQDDFYTGTIAAACGGTTTIVDHVAFGPKGCNLEHQINQYHKLARGKAVIDYGFHGVIQHIDTDVLYKMKTLIDEGITSYKIYMTYDYKLSDEDIYTTLMRAKELGLIIAVHPENDGIVNRRRADFVQAGKTAPIYHALSRPEQCEAEAIGRVLQINRMAGDAMVYIVHLSNNLGMQQINMVRQNGYENIFVETCPQYLTLSDDKYNDDDGIKYIASPPLRHESNNELLWQDIENGDIDTIGTDHCPFDYALKQKMGADDFTKCPNGLPGVETRMPILFSEGVIKMRISPKRFADITAANPAKLFGMYPQKGVIKEGSDADIVIIDPSKKVTVRHESLHENVDFTPYEGLDLECAIDCVISRGDIIVRNNEYIGAKKRGKFIKRGLPQSV
ncbi:MAG: dihydropyrimidinase [Clostridia bacterium]|jgi:dihydropyrimidinase|nr:dihydropyrimidinase [Clostridia bacterium]MBT7123113.1 dihydropyrimidinase [Clostridia bacterium]